METMNALHEHLKKRIPELHRMKDDGIKIIGYTPGGYMPDELVYAAGAIPVGLINGGSPEAVAPASRASRAHLRHRHHGKRRVSRTDGAPAARHLLPADALG